MCVRIRVKNDSKLIEFRRRLSQWEIAPLKKIFEFLVILLLFTNFLCLIITYCEILE